MQIWVWFNGFRSESQHRFRSIASTQSFSVQMKAKLIENRCQHNMRRWREYSYKFAFLWSSAHQRTLQVLRERQGKFCAHRKDFFFDKDLKRKHIKRHFSTCLLQAQKAEMVSRENKVESLFLLTIALSYKFSLNPQPPLTVEFPLFLAFSFAPLPFFSHSLAFPLCLLKGNQSLL